MSTSSHRYDCVRVFLDAIQYQALFDEDPVWSKHGVLEVARYENPIDWRWPRIFQFKEEFYALDVEPGAVVKDVEAYDIPKNEPHLINAFCAEIEGITEEYERLGYQHCFTKFLLGKPLDNDENACDGHLVKQFVSVEDGDFSEINDSERPVNWRMVGNENVRHYAVHIGCKVVSWGILITRDPRISYVGQMFTAPEYRGRGCGSDLLYHMHKEGARMDARTIILMPSYGDGHLVPKIRISVRRGLRNFLP